MNAIKLQNQELKKGEIIFYIGEQGSKQQINEADQLLKKRKEYTLKDIHHGRYETTYILKEYPFIKFNALLFNNYYSF